MKKIILGSLLALGAFACQSKTEKTFYPQREEKVAEVKINTTRQKAFDEQLGAEEHIYLMKKTWQETDAFYKALPEKAHTIQMPEAYLEAMQHNLICAMMQKSSFVEEASKDQFLYYAKEFARVGCCQPNIALIFHQKVGSELSEKASSRLLVMSKGADLKRFEEGREEMRSIRNARK